MCGDGTCDASEDCTSCAADCGACAPVCGDGSCEGSEDCTSCVSDCGACPSVVTVIKAFYRTERQMLWFKGTTTAPRSSRIDIYLGSDTSGELLASAKVRANQTWRKRVRDFPPPAPTTVTVVSRDGGVAQTVTVKVKP